MEKKTLNHNLKNLIILSDKDKKSKDTSKKIIGKKQRNYLINSSPLNPRTSCTRRKMRINW